MSGFDSVCPSSLDPLSLTVNTVRFRDEITLKRIRRKIEYDIQLHFK